ncbi:MAG: dihydropteroate synthase [candidate division WOR-3 bacterium]
MRLLALHHPADLNSELARVGVDQRAWAIFAQKAEVIPLKITGISVAAGNILKQTALVCGADCALHRDAISGRVKKTDAILFATLRQYEQICLRLKKQPECAARLITEIQTLLAAAREPQYRVKLGRNTMNLNRTLIMGIINITPDSFYDGGRYLNPHAALERANQLVEDGADILDIGAESTRPGAEPVSPEEQLKRILPVLKPLVKKTRVPISIDTTSSRVAETVLAEGAALINDISGLKFDPALARICARYSAGLILMHIRGTPRTMQRNPVYKDLMAEITGELRKSIHQALEAGVGFENLLVDPGIGFGKKPEHNLEILRRLAELRTLNRPIVIGPSRKSFIGHVLNLPPEERLEGTITSCIVGALNGASIVRVHDVLPVRRALQILTAIQLDRSRA